MFDSYPSAVAFTLGPLTIGWYGIGYAVGLAVAYAVMVRLAQRAGERSELLVNGMIIVAIAALIGGRAYHVIDQWETLYQDDPLKIILPPYSGLGVYGGIITGTIAAYLYARWKKMPFLRWADIVAPGLFVMQAIGRWGNYFNQELYGPPTTLPWGIPIDAAHRIADYPMSLYPESTRFHPLFLYESISGILGALALIWIGYHLRPKLRPGDLLLVFFIWYGAVRFALESLRAENWTINGIPTAQLVSLAFIIPSVVILLLRHAPRHPVDDPPTFPEVATWGALGRAPFDEDAAFDGDDIDRDDIDWDARATDDAGGDADAEPAETAEAAAPVDDPTRPVEATDEPATDDDTTDDDDPAPAPA
jgi:phosphatidylglycerol:prolipoprotein diacylglycerol transferase